MVNVSDERMELLWGSVLSIVGSIIPFVGSIISLIGFVLYVIGLYGWKEKVDDRPFDYFVRLLIINIIYLIFFFIVVSGTSIFHNNTNDITFTILVFVVLLYPLILINGYYTRKIMTAFYEKTNVENFEIAGELFWYGSILAIIFVGFIIGIVAKIFEIVSYSEIPTELKRRTQTNEIW